MGDFLSTDDLAVYQGQDDADSQAELLISMAEASVRTFCGWNITEETVTEQEQYPIACRFFLPTLNLTDVAEISQGGIVYEAASYSWRRDGRIELFARGFARWDVQPLLVTYTHGYPSGSRELVVVQQVVASIVDRLVQHPDLRLISAQVGSIVDQYAAPPQVPSGLLYHEQASLSALVLPQVA